MSHTEGGGSKPSESKDPAAARITSSAPPDRKTCSLFASWDDQTFDVPACVFSAQRLVQALPAANPQVMVERTNRVSGSLVKRPRADGTRYPIS